MMPKAVILAGGLSRRMGGGNKCLEELGDKTLLNHVIDRLAPQASDLALNFNDDPSLVMDYGLPVLPDILPDFLGPLVGVLTSFKWVKRNWSHEEWVMTVPSDLPFLPPTLTVQLAPALLEGGDVDLVAPSTDGEFHHLCGFWHVRQADDLHHAITHNGTRAVKDWVDQINLRDVVCKTSVSDSFIGVNTRADLKAAQKILTRAD